MAQRAMLVPEPWQGTAQSIPFQDMQWLADMHDRTYLALWQRWPEHDLPLGWHRYVVSFHLEMIDLDWIQRQAERVQAPILLLSDLDHNDYQFHPGIEYHQYYYWHRQLDQIMQWFPAPCARHITHKFSAFCNRITQSKLWVFTALAEYAGQEHCQLKLDTWLEEKNVHHREPCGHAELDYLSHVFYTKYLGQKYLIDDFDNARHNVQSHTANPWHPAYQSVAFNFTNESWHYSRMHDKVLPGPFLTEKTLKCLAGGTPFISVAQAGVYRALAHLGLEFDYGLDLSWDDDTGNISRMAAVVGLIKSMSECSAEELWARAKHSSEHNHDMIWSGEFSRRCEEHNFAVRNLLTGCK